MSRSRPGCLLRAALITFGVLFLPTAIWFAWRDLARYWFQSLVLFAVSAAFLKWGFSKDEDSWVAMVDDLDGPPSDQ